VPPDGRQGIGLDYALTLGHDADPSLVAALPALAGSDRERLLADLDARRVDIGRSEHAGWPAWNWARERADDALSTLVPR
jgi:hypothetical protein